MKELKKRRRKQKLIAAILCMVLVLSSAFTAFAADESTETSEPGSVTISAETEPGADASGAEDNAQVSTGTDTDTNVESGAETSEESEGVEAKTSESNENEVLSNNSDSQSVSSEEAEAKTYGETEETDAESGHTHEDDSYIVWPETIADNSLTGNYYLESDITVSNSITISGQVNICLNGHTMTSGLTDESGSLFVVPAGSSLTLTSCGESKGVLTGNYGRAIECTGSSDKNPATLSVDNVSFKNFVSSGNGGAICAKYTALRVENSEFTNCTSNIITCSSSGSVKNANDTGGGAIWLRSGSLPAVIKASTFSRCKANSNGGAIDFEFENNCTLDGCTFDSCKSNLENPKEGFSSVKYSYGGGGICTHASSGISIKNCKLLNNSSYRGGGLVAFGCSKVVLENNEIKRNTATYRGGGISLVSGTFEIKSGIISNNTAGWGGGIDLTNHGTNIAPLKNVLITDNIAPRGGGVWACPSSSVKMSSTLGGAIYGNTSKGTTPAVEKVISTEEDGITKTDTYPVLDSAGDEVFYNANDTDDKIVLVNWSEDEGSPMTVMQRSLGGYPIAWYSDMVNDRYEKGDDEADPSLYTTATESFALHGELSDLGQKYAEATALIKITGNTATYRGGGIATNAPLQIGMDQSYDTTVTVEKKWTETDEIEQPDEVKVDLYRVDASGSKEKLDSDVVLNAKNEWKVSFTGLPTLYADENGEIQSFTYEVVEQPIDDWKCETKTASTYANRNNIIKIVLTNTYAPTGSLSISKTVSGDGADKEKEFPFEVVLSDETISGAYGDMEFTDGVAELKLKDGDKVEAEKLPAGIEFKVTESDNDGYTVTNTVGEEKKDGSTASGTITKNETVEVAFQNHKDKTSSDTEPVKPDDSVTPTPDSDTSQVATPDSGTSQVTNPETTEEPDTVTAENTSEKQTNSTETKKKNATVKTGDQTNIVFWIVLLVISGIVVVSVPVVRLRRRRR